MRPEQVTEAMNDPLSRELLHSTIPVRLAYNQTDRLPRDPHRVPLEGRAHRLVHLLQRLQGKGACLQPQGGAAYRHQGAIPRAVGARNGEPRDRRRRAPRVPGGGPEESR
jgi:hypothetical protein